jgi:hypothetical protein
MESSIMHFAYMIEHKNMVPKTYLDAMRTAERKQWQDAINAEIRSLLELERWEEVDRPSKFVSYKKSAFIFKKKYIGTNDYVKYKARLVAHGSMEPITEKLMHTYQVIEPFAFCLQWLPPRR